MPLTIREAALLGFGTLSIAGAVLAWRAKATTPLQWADLFGFLGAGAPWLQPASLQWPVLMCFSMLMPVASVAAVAALGVLAVATVMRVRMRVPAARAIMTLKSLAIRALLSRPCSSCHVLAPCPPFPSIPQLASHSPLTPSLVAWPQAGWGTGGRQGAWLTRPGKALG